MKQFTLRSSGADKPEHPLLIGLNQQQLQAVSHTLGPLLIIAGAGSGKTRVLTYRIAYLIDQGVVSPKNVLALTFTNKAAAEMKGRIQKIIGDEARYLWMGTFHSIFGRILRIEADRIGYKTDFSIYDTDDSERAIKQIMKELNVSAQEVKPRAIRNIISSCKNQLITPEQFRQEYVKSSLDDIAAEIFPLYERRLKDSNAMDFDDLIIKPIELFQQHPQALEHYQERFRHILIDEYQDTNRAQYMVTKLLADRYKNICVVGDDAQSIYSFRGADISNILNFQVDYPNATKVPLEQNYRSTAFILKAADSVIKQNKNQLDKTLWTENKGGEVITVLENFTDRDEANRVAKYIRTLKAQRGYSDQDFAILYRTNAQSRQFEDALRRESIAYQLIGGVSFYQRKEIKDVVAYLKLLVNPSDEEALRRIINEPARGIGDKTIDTLLFHARNEHSTLWHILKRVDTYPVYGPAKARIAQFVDMMEEATSMLGKKRLLEITQWLMKESGYMQQFIDERTQDAYGRRDNVIEFMNALSFFEQNSPEPSLSSFLQEVALYSDQDDLDDFSGVTLMTIHASKGLEFPVVFIVGLEEDLFPSAAWGDNEVDYEEERRLFYVAITRAQKELYMSYARSRFKFGEERSMRQSRFLKEVDPSVLRNELGASFHASGKDDRYVSPPKPRIQSVRGHDIVYEDENRLMKQNEGSGIQIEYDGVDASRFNVGTLVVHDKFGEGKVVGKEGFGDRAKVTVFFRQHGQKKLVLKFANLTIIS